MKGGELAKRRESKQKAEKQLEDGLAHHRSLQQNFHKHMQEEQRNVAEIQTLEQHLKQYDRAASLAQISEAAAVAAAQAALLAQNARQELQVDSNATI